MTLPDFRIKGCKVCMLATASIMVVLAVAGCCGSISKNGAIKATEYGESDRGRKVCGSNRVTVGLEAPFTTQLNALSSEVYYDYVLGPETLSALSTDNSIEGPRALTMYAYVVYDDLSKPGRPIAGNYYHPRKVLYYGDTSGNNQLSSRTVLHHMEQLCWLTVAGTQTGSWHHASDDAIRTRDYATALYTIRIGIFTERNPMVREAGQTVGAAFSVVAIYIKRGRDGQGRRALVGMFDVESSNMVFIFDERISSEIEKHYVELYELVAK